MMFDGTRCLLRAGQRIICRDSHDLLSTMLLGTAVVAIQNIRLAASKTLPSLPAAKCSDDIIRCGFCSRHHNFRQGFGGLSPAHHVGQHRLAGQIHQYFTGQALGAHAGLNDGDDPWHRRFLASRDTALRLL